MAKKTSPKSKPKSSGLPAGEWPPDPKRVKKIVQRLARDYDPVCALNYRNGWELLQATVLSAQCTDERVNQVTPDLFERWPTPEDLAEADQEEVEAVIRSTGFYRNKSRNLIQAAQAIAEQHGGKIPQDMESLVALPGVARKTANVILGTAYGKNEGVVVDTHVKRVTQRLGLTREEKPPAIEKDLMEFLPRKKWTDLGHQLIWHGRRICLSRKPKCSECMLADVCPSAFQV